MRNKCVISWMVFCLLLAGRVASSSAADPAAAATSEMPIVYKVPAGFDSLVRVDGAMRGAGGSTTTLFLLAPEHVGLTTKEQPSIFWYQSKPVKTRVELTILQDRKIIPVFEWKLASANEAGIHRLRLSDHHLKLASGIEYRCTVALVVDEQSRSRDILASAVIKRVDPFASLKTRLADARSSEMPFIYASEGIWFDAIESLADLIDTQSDRARFHRQRAALLEQVKLPDVAAYDTQLAKAN